jgi:hypothetical protein
MVTGADGGGGVQACGWGSTHVYFRLISSDPVQGYEMH